MNTEKIMELHKQHRESQSKYTYFILAVAASAIAFAVQKTSGSTYTWFQLPLGGAITFWSLSFYYGCRNIDWVQTAVMANQSLLSLYDGVHPEQPETNEETKIAIAGTMKALMLNVETAKKCGDRQFNYLVIGAILFILWHLLDNWATP